MKTYLKFLFFSSALLLSCNDEQKKTTESTESPAAPTASVPATKECYSFIRNKDTVSLSIVIAGNVASGHLLYNYFEKDQNRGTLNGRFYGDTLIAEYYFKSEGKLSTREVAFLRKGNTLIEGYGDSEYKVGRTFFKNRGQLNYENSTILTKVDCK